MSGKGKTSINRGNQKSAGLTPKQAAFVDEYLVDLNASKAAIRAGYSEKTADQQAYQLLQKTSVHEAIAARMKERQKRTGITQDYVLQTIQETIERCKQAEPVLDKDGSPTGEYRFDATSILKGAELLGRHLGTWNDKLKLQGDPEAPLEVKTKVVLVPTKQAAAVEKKPLSLQD